MKIRCLSKWKRIKFVLFIFTVFFMVINLKTPFYTLTENETKAQNVRIFCIILTKIDDWDTKANATYQTWASECTNHRFITLIPDHLKQLKNENKQSIEFVNKNGLHFLQPNEFIKEDYSHLTDKVWLAITDVYKNYKDYDWYLKADDDTFIFMNNLRKFLVEKSLNESLAFGFKISDYFSGGAGYVFNKVIEI
jgi:glycoprotein-N-acetylgalactosamine 3-beta-galactosyltransferase